MLLNFSRIMSSYLDTRFVRNVKAKRQRRTERPAAIESLEARALLTAPLVADVLQGTAGTTVSGTVYEDLDSNGVKDPGENGVSGWTVYLDLDHSGTLNNDAAGTPEPSAITNVDGDYVINRLIPGNYRVSEVVQSGWTPTAPVSQDVDVRLDHDTRANFFNFAGGDIVGTVWNDVDQDGIRATDPVTGDFTEPGLAGWTMFLDLNNNLAPDAGEPTTLTDAMGGYSFVNLPAGDYEVTELLPDGWEPTKHFDIRQTAGVVAQQQAVQDFANFSLLNGSIQGTIWNDLNADGIRAADPDTGKFTDPGLAGWTVFLDLNVDGIAQAGEPTTVTNSDGEYTFISVVAGDYEVTEVLPSGWYISPTFDTRQTVAVLGGEKSTAGDFANFTIQNGSIRGTVWNDLNRDGIRNVSLAGEFTDPPLQSWQIFLDLNRNKLADAGEPVTLTDVNGAYTFADLQVGDYEVQEILPTGWETTVTYDNAQTVTVFSGTESTARDFANFNLSTAIPGTVSGIVWNDLNGNGVRDVNVTTGAFTDPGLANWTIFVDVNANGTFDSTEPTATSAADGSYSISGVLPGTVRVIEVSQAGWRPTAPGTGARTFALKNGENATDLDFGNYTLQEAAIRGTVYADSNHDGIRNIGERGLSEITVYLDTNDNGVHDVGEPSTTTSPDLFFTPAVDEAGTYNFTHLAAGTYTVRTIVPDTLSATPAAQLVHTVTLIATEDHPGIDTAAVFRPNEIHGVKFDDSNGNHQRDAGELGAGGVTIYIDLDRDDVLDPEEPTTVTASDGSYSFGSLTPGAYVVREILDDGYETTYPTTAAGTLWPDGISNPAVGNVTPTSITASLADGQAHHETVSITLPNTGAVTNLVDVFLLFDDTGSFVNNSPLVRAAFPTIIAQLQAALPGIDLGFGVGRFEEYGNFAYEYSTGRPFILNQPIVAASTPGYMTAIQAALNRTTPGYGGDQPETDIEALYQLVTGLGFDGNNNGSVLDSGVAGLASTQLTPGNSGDVPSFASFQADLANSVLPAAGNVGGGGFRPGALPIILTATDTGFAYQPFGETSITGVGGVTLPISALTGTSRPTTPFNSGAGIQETITALNALGALVIGLGTNPQATLDPRQGLEALSTLTGAVNHSTTTIANGTADPIAPGDPLYFQISSGFAGSVADGVVNAIQNAATNVAVNITVQASDPRVKIINHTGVQNSIGSGQTATFDIEFVGDGVPHRFDLQFVRAGTNVILGSIPVVLGTPIPGDGYEFEDLPEGEIHSSVDFGSHLVSTTNVAPVALDGSLIATEDTAQSGTLVATDTDSVSLTYSIVADASHGTVTMTDPLTGAYTYTPAANYSGLDSFTFKAYDGSLNSNVATVSIAVAAVNDAPRAIDGNLTTTEDTPQIALLAATDVDSTSLTYSIVANASHGTVVITDPTTGAYTYSPMAAYNGPDSFTFKAHDGTTDSNVATVAITVTAVNSAPVAADGSLSVSEDTTQSGTLVATDLDSASLTYSIVANAVHGTVVVTDPATGAYSYTPDTDYNGLDSFTFKAIDGLLDSNIATVSITVSAVNDAPLAVDGNMVAVEDVPQSGTLVATDVDSAPLTFSIVAHPTHGTVTIIDPATGTYTFAPAADYSGLDSFTFKANDGTLDSNTVTVSITITSVNDAPVAVDGSLTLTEDMAQSGILVATDVDSAALSYSLVTNPSHGTVTIIDPATGAYTYTPAAQYNGSDSFSFKAHDGALDSNVATVWIVVAAVNDAPVAIADNYSLNAGATLNVAAPGVLTNDQDIDADTLSAVLVQGPAHGLLTLNADGSFSYTPDANFVGTDNFTYQASDGTLSSSAMQVTLVVNAVVPTLPQFVVVDDKRDSFFNYAGADVNQQELSSSNRAPQGITTNADGSRTWVADLKGFVHVYDSKQKLIGKWQAVELEHVTGITTNGTDIWLVDSKTDSIHRFAGACSRMSGKIAPTSSFRLDRENRNPTDLITDNLHFWVVNDTSKVDKVFLYSLDGTLEGSWAIDPANSNPTGLALNPTDPNQFWILDGRSQKLYDYQGGAFRTSGSQNATSSFKLSAANRDAEGVVIASSASTASVTSAALDTVFQEFGKVQPTTSRTRYWKD